MGSQAVRNFVNDTFASAGIDLDRGHRCGIRIRDPRFYEKVWQMGSLGLGESYMDGWWDADHIDVFIHDLLKAGVDSKPKLSFQNLRLISKYLFLNPQSRRRALEVGKRHYDIGNDLFVKMLDKRMVYSCAYWQNAANLDEAQEHKLDLVCRKLNLKSGMRVLDIGCGWGGFAKYAAEKYGVEVVGITISQEQLELAKTLCQGLPITLRFQDYRDVGEKFDRIVSIGQMEHVGSKNYRTYMEMVDRCLAPNGLFLLHTIGGNQATKNCDPWIERYIFPNGMIPSADQLVKAAEGLFIFEDWHNFGPDYDKTLLAWHHNVVTNWESLKSRYDERFFRMWKYYLLSCAGAFRCRDLQLWQIVFARKGTSGTYVGVR